MWASQLTAVHMLENIVYMSVNKNYIRTEDRLTSWYSKVH